MWFTIIKGDIFKAGPKRTATKFQTKSIRRTLISKGEATTKEILTSMMNDREKENIERLSGKIYVDGNTGRSRTKRTLSSRQIPPLTTLRAMLFRHPFVEKTGVNIWRWIGD
tara:strand:+ start:574 stop:909 length:336 start_codon:yes stop_codon:yes gene_type:complete